MRSLPRWFIATVLVIGAVGNQPTAQAQDLDPRTGLPNQTGVSYIANGTSAPYTPTGQYGATLQPTQAPGDDALLGGELGSGAQYVRFMPRVSLVHLAGSGLGYQSSFTTVEAWIPLQIGDEHQLMFADMRGIVNNDSRIGGNLGVGFRQFNRESNRVFGLNGYFDYRDSGNARYNQIGAGFESLGEVFDFRGNVYIPLNDEVTLISDTFDCDNPTAIGSFLFVTRNLRRESAMRGFDVEGGTCLIPRWRTKAFLGAYFFDGRETPQAYGARVRLETYATESIQLQLTFQHDRVFGSNVWGGVTVSLPGAYRRDASNGQPDMLDRLNDPVQRLYNVVVTEHTQTTQEASTSVVTGQPIRFIYVDQSAPGGGDGTFESPFTTLNQAEVGSQPGDIIFVRSGNYVGESIALQLDQRLLGDGIALPVAGDPKRLGGYLIPTTQCPDGILLPNVSTNPADRPNIIGAPGDAVTLADRNEVAGFNILNSGNSGIAGNGIQSFDLHDLVISQSGGDGIRITDAFGTGSIRNVTLNQNGGSGVNLTNTGASVLNAELICVFATNNGVHGIELNALGNSGITAIVDQSFATGNQGFGLAGTADGGNIDITISASQFNNNVLGGTLLNALNGGNITGNITGSQFNTNAGGLNPSSGLLFLAGDTIGGSSGSVALNISGSQFIGNADSGLNGRMDGAASTTDLVLNNNVFSQNTFAGFAMNAQNGVFTGSIVGNQFVDNVRQGIAYQGFAASSATIDLIGNTITGNGTGGPPNSRDGVLLQLFTSNANSLTANFVGNLIANNGSGGRGNGVNISGFNTGTAVAGVTVSFNGDVISGNQENGINALLGGGAAGVPLAANFSVINAFIDSNGSDGIQLNNNQFAALTATVDDSVITNNGVNGVNIQTQALAIGEAPRLDTRIEGNTISDNGTAQPLFAAAGINIGVGGFDGVQNNININNNTEIARNSVGILILTSERTATAITNHRNILNDNPRIFDNTNAGVIVGHIRTGGTVPADRSAVHDVFISNNAIDSPSEAIVLLALGGNPVIPLAGGRMDALVTQNLLTGPGFVSTVGDALFGPLPPGFVNRGTTNARFLAVSGGARSYMRLRLEQNNVNDLQYNLINAGPVVTQVGNTDGSLFDVASTAGTNSGFSNPLLAAEFFGVNTGVYGFANGGVGFIDPPGPPPSTAFGADFDPVNTNLQINVVQPNLINPGPFPPPP